MIHPVAPFACAYFDTHMLLDTGSSIIAASADAPAIGAGDQLTVSPRIS
jgi:hypothetical protein